MKSITQVVQNLLKPYIDNHDNAVAANFAPVETDATSASQDYVIGDELVLDGVLYDVTAPITTGDALATTGAGANITAADKTSTQIQTLANSLSTETTNRENADSNIVTTIAKNGAMNLAPNDATTQVVSGVTFSIDKTNSATNGIITLSGTASEAITLVLGKFKVPIGSYVLSSKADGSKARVTVEAYNGNTWKSLLATTASSDDVSFNVDYSNYDTLWISVRIDSGTNVNGVVVKPMVSVIAGEYVPYAKTNREITDELSYETGFCTKVTTSPVDQNAINVYRYGKVIVVVLSVKFSTTATGPVTVGTLTKYLPPNMVIGIVTVGSYTSTAYVDTDGNIKLTGNVPNVGAWLYGNIVYVIND